MSDVTQPCDRLPRALGAENHSSALALCFKTLRDELARSEMQYGTDAGRIAVSLDLLTDALVMVMQHGV